MTDEQEQQSMVVNGDIVHLVIDYWDGPREGVADYGGTLHYFKALFDEKKDEWSNVFNLSPLDPDTYTLVIERQRIWERWKEAYDAGAATLDSHPALPEETPRIKELSQIIQERTDAEHPCVRLKGRFEADDRTKSDTTWRVYWCTAD